MTTVIRHVPLCVIVEEPYICHVCWVILLNPPYFIHTWIQVQCFFAIKHVLIYGIQKQRYTQAQSKILIQLIYVLSIYDNNYKQTYYHEGIWPQFCCWLISKNSGDYFCRKYDVFVWSLSFRKKLWNNEKKISKSHTVNRKKVLHDFHKGVSFCLDIVFQYV